VTETQGIFKPSWTIAEVGENIAAIRDDSKTWIFHPVPTGFTDHLGRSFEMAKNGSGST